MHAPKWRPLLAILAASPAIAGITGGAIIWTGLSIARFALASDTEWPVDDFASAIAENLLVAIAGFMPAAVVGALWAYLFASPVILGTWVIAHVLRWRAPLAMATTLGFTVMAFTVAVFRSGVLNYAGFEGQALWVLLVIVPGGFISGFVAGFLIARIGYRGTKRLPQPAA